MSTTRKTEITVPKSIRRKAGFKPGEQVEFRVSDRAITIVPKLPAALDEYTPAQRRLIDWRLTAAEDEAGRLHGPFTAKEATAFIEDLAKQRVRKKTAK